MATVFYIRLIKIVARDATRRDVLKFKKVEGSFLVFELNQQHIHVGCLIRVQNYVIDDLYNYKGQQLVITICLKYTNLGNNIVLQNTFLVQLILY